MFETLIESLLKTYLGGYIENIDKNKLSIGIISGEISLEDIKIKPNILDKFNLPFDIVLAQIGKIKGKLPWRDNFNSPTIVEVIDIKVILRILNKEEWKHLDLLSFENKRSKLESIFNEQIESLTDNFINTCSNSEKNSSYIEKITQRIINNLKLSIKHIHVRIEEKINLFSIGFTLQEINVFNISEKEYENTKNITINNKMPITNKDIINEKNLINNNTNDKKQSFKSTSSYNSNRNSSINVTESINYKRLDILNFGVYLNIKEANFLYKIKEDYNIKINKENKENKENKVSIHNINKNLYDILSKEANNIFDIKDLQSNNSEYIISPMNLCVVARIRKNILKQCSINKENIKTKYYNIDSFESKLDISINLDHFNITIEKEVFDTIVSLSNIIQAYQVFQTNYYNSRIYYLSKPEELKIKQINRNERIYNLNTNNKNDIKINYNNKKYIKIWKWAIKTILNNLNNSILKDKLNNFNSSIFLNEFNLSNQIIPFKHLTPRIVDYYKIIYKENISKFIYDNFKIINDNKHSFPIVNCLKSNYNKNFIDSIMILDIDYLVKVMIPLIEEDIKLKKINNKKTTYLKSTKKGFFNNLFSSDKNDSKNNNTTTKTDEELNKISLNSEEIQQLKDFISELEQDVEINSLFSSIKVNILLEKGNISFIKEKSDISKDLFNKHHDIKRNSFQAINNSNIKCSSISNIDKRCSILPNKTNLLSIKNNSQNKYEIKNNLFTCYKGINLIYNNLSFCFIKEDSLVLLNSKLDYFKINLITIFNNKEIIEKDVICSKLDFKDESSINYIKEDNLNNHNKLDNSMFKYLMINHSKNNFYCKEIYINKINIFFSIQFIQFTKEYFFNVIDDSNSYLLLKLYQEISYVKHKTIDILKGSPVVANNNINNFSNEKKNCNYNNKIKRQLIVSLNPITVYIPINKYENLNNTSCLIFKVTDINFIKLYKDYYNEEYNQYFSNINGHSNNCINSIIANKDIIKFNINNVSLIYKDFNLVETNIIKHSSIILYYIINEDITADSNLEKGSSVLPYKTIVNIPQVNIHLNQKTYTLLTMISQLIKPLETDNEIWSNVTDNNKNIKVSGIYLGSIMLIKKINNKVKNINADLYLLGGYLYFLSQSNSNKSNDIKTNNNNANSEYENLKLKNINVSNDNNTIPNRKDSLKKETFKASDAYKKSFDSSMSLEYKSTIEKGSISIIDRYFIANSKLIINNDEVILNNNFEKITIQFQKNNLAESIIKLKLRINELNCYNLEYNNVRKLLNEEHLSTDIKNNEDNFNNQVKQDNLEKEEPILLTIINNVDFYIYDSINNNDKLFLTIQINDLLIQNSIKTLYYSKCLINLDSFKIFSNIDNPNTNCNNKDNIKNNSRYISLVEYTSNKICNNTNTDKNSNEKYCFFNKLKKFIFEIIINSEDLIISEKKLKSEIEVNINIQENTVHMNYKPDYFCFLFNFFLYNDEVKDSLIIEIFRNNLDKHSNNQINFENFNNDKCNLLEKLKYLIKTNYYFKFDNALSSSICQIKCSSLVFKSYLNISTTINKLHINYIHPIINESYAYLIIDQNFKLNFESFEDHNIISTFINKIKLVDNFNYPFNNMDKSNDFKVNNTYVINDFDLNVISKTINCPLRINNVEDNINISIKDGFAYIYMENFIRNLDMIIDEVIDSFKPYKSHIIYKKKIYDYLKNEDNNNTYNTNNTLISNKNESNLNQYNKGLTLFNLLIKNNVNLYFPIINKHTETNNDNIKEINIYKDIYYDYLIFKIANISVTNKYALNLPNYNNNLSLNGYKYKDRLFQTFEINFNYINIFSSYLNKSNKINLNSPELLQYLGYIDCINVQISLLDKISEFDLIAKSIKDFDKSLLIDVLFKNNTNNINKTCPSINKIILCLASKDLNLLQRAIDLNLTFKDNLQYYFSKRLYKQPNNKSKKTLFELKKITTDSSCICNKNAPHLNDSDLNMIDIKFNIDVPIIDILLLENDYYNNIDSKNNCFILKNNILFNNSYFLKIRLNEFKATFSILFNKDIQSVSFIENAGAVFIANNRANSNNKYLSFTNSTNCDINLYLKILSRIINMSNLSIIQLKQINLNNKSEINEHFFNQAIYFKVNVDADKTMDIIIKLNNLKILVKSDIIITKLLNYINNSQNNYNSYECYCQNLIKLSNNKDLCIDDTLSTANIDLSLLNNYSTKMLNVDYCILDNNLNYNNKNNYFFCCCKSNDYYNKNIKPKIKLIAELDNNIICFPLEKINLDSAFINFKSKFICLIYSLKLLFKKDVINDVYTEFTSKLNENKKSNLEDIISSNPFISVNFWLDNLTPFYSNYNNLFIYDIDVSRSYCKNSNLYSLAYLITKIYLTGEYRCLFETNCLKNNKKCDDIYKINDNKNVNFYNKLFLVNKLFIKFTDEIKINLTIEDIINLSNIANLIKNDILANNTKKNCNLNININKNNNNNNNAVINMNISSSIMQKSNNINVIIPNIQVILLEQNSLIFYPFIKISIDNLNIVYVSKKHSSKTNNKSKNKFDEHILENNVISCCTILLKIFIESFKSGYFEHIVERFTPIINIELEPNYNSIEISIPLNVKKYIYKHNLTSECNYSELNSINDSLSQKSLIKNNQLKINIIDNQIMSILNCFNIWIKKVKDNIDINIKNELNLNRKISNDNDDIEMLNEDVNDFNKSFELKDNAQIFNKEQDILINKSNKNSKIENYSSVPLLLELGFLSIFNSEANINKIYSSILTPNSLGIKEENAKYIYNNNNVDIDNNNVLSKNELISHSFFSFSIIKEENSKYNGSLICYIECSLLPIENLSITTNKLENISNNASSGIDNSTIKRNNKIDNRNSTDLLSLKRIDTCNYNKVLNIFKEYKDNNDVDLNHQGSDISIKNSYIKNYDISNLDNLNLIKNNSLSKILDKNLMLKSIKTTKIRIKINCPYVCKLIKFNIIEYIELNNYLIERNIELLDEYAYIVVISSFIDSINFIKIYSPLVIENNIDKYQVSYCLKNKSLFTDYKLIGFKEQIGIDFNYFSGILSLKISINNNKEETIYLLNKIVIKNIFKETLEDENNKPDDILSNLCKLYNLKSKLNNTTKLIIKELKLTNNNENYLNNIYCLVSIDNEIFNVKKLNFNYPLIIKNNLPFNLTNSILILSKLKNDVSLIKESYVLDNLNFNSIGYYSDISIESSIEIGIKFYFNNTNNKYISLISTDCIKELLNNNYTNSDEVNLINKIIFLEELDININLEISIDKKSFFLSFSVLTFNVQDLKNIIINETLNIELFTYSNESKNSKIPCSKLFLDEHKYCYSNLNKDIGYYKEIYLISESCKFIQICVKSIKLNIITHQSDIISLGFINSLDIFLTPMHHLNCKSNSYVDTYNFTLIKQRTKNNTLTMKAKYLINNKTHYNLKYSLVNKNTNEKSIIKSDVVKLQDYNYILENIENKYISLSEDSSDSNSNSKNNHSNFGSKYYLLSNYNKIIIIRVPLEFEYCLDSCTQDNLNESNEFNSSTVKEISEINNKIKSVYLCLSIEDSYTFQKIINISVCNNTLNNRIKIINRMNNFSIILQNTLNIHNKEYQDYSYFYSNSKNDNEFENIIDDRQELLFGFINYKNNNKNLYIYEVNLIDYDIISKEEISDFVKIKSDRWLYFKLENLLKGGEFKLDVYINKMDYLTDSENEINKNIYKIQILVISDGFNFKFYIENDELFSDDIMCLTNNNNNIVNDYKINNNLTNKILFNIDNIIVSFIKTNSFNLDSNNYNNKALKNEFMLLECKNILLYVALITNNNLSTFSEYNFKLNFLKLKHFNDNSRQFIVFESLNLETLKKKSLNKSKYSIIPFINIYAKTLKLKDNPTQIILLNYLIQAFLINIDTQFLITLFNYLNTILENLQYEKCKYIENFVKTKDNKVDINDNKEISKVNIMNKNSYMIQIKLNKYLFIGKLEGSPIEIKLNIKFNNKINILNNVINNFIMLSYNIESLSSEIELINTNKYNTNSPNLKNILNNNYKESLLKFKGNKVHLYTWISLINLDNATIELNQFVINNITINRSNLLKTIINNYKQPNLASIFKLIFSAEIIGNPYSLINNLRIGVTDFYTKPKEGIIKGPVHLVKGVIDGSASLIKHTLQGMLNSVSKMSSSINSNFVSLSDDNNFIDSFEQDSYNKIPDNIIEGIYYGGNSMVKGILSGVTDLVYKPYTEVKEKGYSGIFTGVYKGLSNFIIKPISGTISLISKSTEGLKNNMNIKTMFSKYSNKYDTYEYNMYHHYDKQSCNIDYVKDYLKEFELRYIDRAVYGSFSLIKEFNWFHSHINKKFKDYINNKIDKNSKLNSSSYVFLDACLFESGYINYNLLAVITTSNVFYIYDMKDNIVIDNVFYSDIINIDKIWNIKNNIIDNNINNTNLINNSIDSSINKEDYKKAIVIHLNSNYCNNINDNNNSNDNKNKLDLINNEFIDIIDLNKRSHSEIFCYNNKFTIIFHENTSKIVFNYIFNIIMNGIDNYLLNSKD